MLIILISKERFYATETNLVQNICLLIICLDAGGEDILFPKKDFMLPKQILCKKNIVDYLSPRRWRGHFVSKGRWIATDCRLWRVQQQQQQRGAHTRSFFTFRLLDVLASLESSHTRSLVTFHLLHVLASLVVTLLTRSLGYTFKFEV